MESKKTQHIVVSFKKFIRPINGVEFFLWFLKIIASVFVIVIPTVYFGFEGQPTEMGIMAVAGSIAAAFINIDKIQKVKGAGFEAEMKKVVDEAYATIDILKNTTIPLMLTTIDTLTWGKRLSKINYEKVESMINDILKITKDLNIKDEKIENALIEYYSLQIFDRCRDFTKEIQQLDVQKGKDSKYSNSIFESLNNNIDYKRVLFPKEEQLLNILQINKEDLSNENLIKLNAYLNCLELNSKKILCLEKHIYEF